MKFDNNNIDGTMCDWKYRANTKYPHAFMYTVVDYFDDISMKEKENTVHWLICNWSVCVGWILIILLLIAFGQFKRLDQFINIHHIFWTSEQWNEWQPWLHEHHILSNNTNWSVPLSLQFQKISFINQIKIAQQIDENSRLIGNIVKVCKISIKININECV